MVSISRWKSCWIISESANTRHFITGFPSLEGVFKANNNLRKVEISQLQPVLRTYWRLFRLFSTLQQAEAGRDNARSQIPEVGSNSSVIKFGEFVPRKRPPETKWVAESFLKANLWRLGNQFSSESVEKNCGNLKRNWLKLLRIFTMCYFNHNSNYLNEKKGFWEMINF